MKKTRILCIVSFFIVSPLLQAQLCWKISGNGLGKSSVLFGTHHVMNCCNIPHIDDIMKLCVSSEAVVGELVQDDSLDQIMLESVSMNDKSLESLLSPDEYKLVDSEVRRVMGAGLELMDGMKPLYVGSVYTVMSYLKALGLSEQPVPIDELLQQKGKEKGLKLIGLETPREQVDLLYNSIPLEQQAEMLVQTILEKDQATQQAEELNKAYMAGDLKEIEKIGKADPLSAEETALFVDKRNAKWMQSLTNLIKDQSCFIAVGCLHLVGETGLINQLRHAGYSVEPMQFN